MEPEKKRNSLRNWLRVLRRFGVELVVFLNAVGAAFYNVTYRSGIYPVVCLRTFGDDPEVDCHDLRRTPAAEIVVQKAASDFATLTTICYMVPATVADLLLGALSDRFGRKLSIQIGMTGSILLVFATLVVFASPRAAPLSILLAANVVAGATGFVSIVVISSYAYLVDTVTDRRHLTVRMALLQASIDLGNIAGALLGGLLSSHLSVPHQILISLSILSAAFFLGLAVLLQATPAVSTKAVENDRKSGVDIVAVAEPAVGRRNKPLDIVRRTLGHVLQLLRDIWRTYARRRSPRHCRAYLLSASVIVFVSIAADNGLRFSVFSLYVQKAPLSWRQATIGYFDSASGAATAVGTVVAVFLLQKLLDVSDTGLVLLALASALGESLLIAFSDRTWMIFVSAVIGCLSSLVKPCMKSFVAKVIDANQIGKAFTVFGISQNLALLTSSIVCNSIYKATIEIFPGFVYIFSAILLVLVFALALWVHVDFRRTSPVADAKSHQRRCKFTLATFFFRQSSVTEPKVVIVNQQQPVT